MSKQETSVERVAGVELAKVDKDVVDSYLAKFKIKVPAGAVLREKIKRLSEHQKKTPANHLADCDNCGGDSDVRLDACPFCGIGDDPTQQPAKKDGGKGKVKGKGKTPPKPEPEPEPEPVTEIVDTKVDAKGLAALDKSVKRVGELRAQGAMCMWELGKEIFTIYEKRLYVQRRTKDGKSARYKSWSQFCQVELSMSPTQSYKLMDISQLFARKDVKQLGTAKLGIMVQLPDKERTELLERARKEGLSKSAVAEEVRKLAEGKGSRDTGRTGFRGPKGAQAKGAKAAAQAKAAKRATNEVTVATQLGRVTIPLYQRPKKKPKEGEQLKRATTLAQDPFGSEQMANSIVTHYRVVKQAKGLAIVVERVREEPSK